jgi:16S rRNA C967 or C1407 C5-methylase (RsmB/RsmF family)/NOL1/NOP2/fmu family ribosome biogenesis protein
MFPEAFITRISLQKYIDAEALLQALAEPSPVSIRINRSKWLNEPSDSVAVPWSESGYYLRSRPSFTADPLFHSGCYYPQEASGMFLEQVILQTFDPSEGIKALDLCGAPGGKSTIISDILGRNGLLVSNEVIRSRALILAETATKWGSGNILVTQSDPSAFKNLPGFFDIILIDAPCSGEGMFRTEIARSEWSPENTSLCSERQKRILMDVWPCLKENGILIYSTCTFNPGENEEIISWLTGKKEAECLRLDISAFPGIKEIDHMGIFGYGFYPNRITGEGLFIAALRKTSSEDRWLAGKKKQSEMKPSRADYEIAGRLTSFSYDRIARRGEEIIGLPCTPDCFSDIYANMKVVKPGTVIATMKNNDLIPSHELALSVALKPDAFPSHESEIHEAINLLRRDNISSEGFQNGWNVMKYNGIPIGFIKNIGRRLNNYFPVEWRIRLNKDDLAEKQIVRWKENPS